MGGGEKSYMFGNLGDSDLMSYYGDNWSLEKMINHGIGRVHKSNIIND